MKCTMITRYPPPFFPFFISLRTLTVFLREIPILFFFFFPPTPGGGLVLLGCRSTLPLSSFPFAVILTNFHADAPFSWNSGAVRSPLFSPLFFFHRNKKNACCAVFPPSPPGHSIENPSFKAFNLERLFCFPPRKDPDREKKCLAHANTISPFLLSGRTVIVLFRSASDRLRLTFLSFPFFLLRFLRKGRAGAESAGATSDPYAGDTFSVLPDFCPGPGAGAPFFFFLFFSFSLSGFNRDFHWNGRLRWVVPPPLLFISVKNRRSPCRRSWFSPPPSKESKKKFRDFPFLLLLQGQGIS